MKCRATSLSHIGHVRQINQDAVLVRPEQGYYLVADGMGGEKAGEEASAEVAITVEQRLEPFFITPPENPLKLEETLRETLFAAHNNVQRIAQEQPEKRGLGSTASLLALHRGMYFIAQVGDSRVYLSRRGKLRQLTNDHTMVWQMYARGQLTRSQLESHPDRHLLTECIGVPHPLRIDTFHGRIRSGDLFLVCSDGLTGYANEEDIIRLLLVPKMELERRAEALLRLALDAGGGDNVSVILVQVESLNQHDDWRPAPRRASPEADTLTESPSSIQTVTQGIELENAKKLPPDRSRMIMLGAGILLAIALLTFLVALFNASPKP